MRVLILNLLDVILLKKYQLRVFKHRFGVFYCLISYLYYYLCKFSFLLSSSRDRKFDIEKSNSIYRNGYTDTNFKYSRLLELFDKEVEKSIQLEEGKQLLPKRSLKIFEKEISDILEKEVGPIINSYWGTYFKISKIAALKSFPTEMKDTGPYLFHFDDVDRFTLKVFFYLNDQAEENGAFRFFDRKDTNLLLESGFDSTSRGVREKTQKIIIDKIKKNEVNLTIADRKLGSLFIWQNNLIHKGSFPISGERKLIQIEIKPTHANKKICFEKVKNTYSLFRLVMRLI